MENSAGNPLFTVDPSGNAVATSSMTVPVVIQPRAAQIYSSGTVTINAAAGDSVITLTASSSTPATITGPAADQVLRITWIQNSTGGWTYSWPANCHFAGASAPSDTAASTRTTVTFRYDASASAWYELDRAVAVG